MCGVTITRIRYRRAKKSAAGITRREASRMLREVGGAMLCASVSSCRRSMGNARLPVYRDPQMRLSRVPLQISVATMTNVTCSHCSPFWVGPLVRVPHGFNCITGRLT